MKGRLRSKDGGEWGEPHGPMAQRRPGQTHAGRPAGVSTLAYVGARDGTPLHTTACPWGHRALTRHDPAHDGAVRQREG